MDSGKKVEFEAPYGAIARALKRGRVVPFLGAGVSLSAQHAEAGEEGAKAGGLPSAKELSHRLAKLGSFPAESDTDLDDLSKVASYYAETSGRGNLREMLHETFNRDFTPGKVHRYLADIDKPLLVVTTNYDDLVERAFKEKGRPYDLVIHPTDRADMAGAVLWWKGGETEPIPEDPRRIPMNERLKQTTVIYKMHGSVMRSWYRGASPPQTQEDEDDRAYLQDSYVITEEDYIDFLHRMTGQVAVPTQFMDYFSTRQFLFLGYRLRDWNLRVVLKNLNSVLKKQQANNMTQESEDPSWAIQSQPSLLEEKLWQRRGIHIYDKDLNQFIDELREHDNDK